MGKPRQNKSPRRSVAATGLTTIALLLAATGCGEDGGDSVSDATGAAPAAEEADVAFVQAHMASTFRTQMIEGVEEAAEQHDLAVDVYNSNNDVVKQNQAIDNYVTQGADVIVVAAIELQSVLPAISAAADTGTQIIAVDTIIDNPAVAAQVGVDNRAGGVTMGEIVAEDAAEEFPDGDATIGIVSALNSEIQNLRADGFTEGLDKAAKVVQTVDGQNRQEKAVDEAENLLTANPELDYIYATGEPALIGTIAAIAANGRDDVKVYGWDLSDEGIRALDNGLVVAIANQPAKEEGIRAVELADKLAAGEGVEHDNILEINVVTKDNVDEYRTDYS